MTNLFTFTPDTPASGDVIRSQHMRNVQNAVQQLMGIITDSGTAITGVTTLNVGAFLCASGSASTGVTIYNRGINVVTPSGSVVSGNVINLLNGTNMLIGSQGNSITFHTVGTTSDANFPFTDIVTGNVSSLRHGFAPKSVADDYKFLNSAGTPTYTSISGEVLVLNDSTTNNVSSVNHGFAPKTSGNQFQFLNSAGTPAYTAISGEVLTLYDSTINNTSSVNHGFAPKTSGNQFEFLNSAGTPAYTAISGEVLTLYDSTINDVSTTKHGFAPKATNVGYFLRDDGSYADIGTSSYKYILTGGVVLKNSVAQTDLLGGTATGKGTLTFAANNLFAGKTIKIKAYGIYDLVGATATATGRINLGTTTLCEHTATIAGNPSASGYIELEVSVMFYQSGSTAQCYAIGKLLTLDDNSAVASKFPILVNPRGAAFPTTIDATSSQTLAYVFNWGSASTTNTIFLQMGTVELI